MFYSNKESNTPWRNHLNRSYYGYGYEATTLQNQGWDIPSADVLELDDQFILELALPGVVLDDIEVKVEENFLTVTAKRTPVMFQDRATYLRKELPSTLMVREFEFETEIMAEHIEARLDRGLLFISVPKTTAAIRIPVTHGTLENHMGALKNRSHKTEVRSAKEVAIK
ncbi:MAG: Hsp20/alpha crystallin family protein [Candidatus Obscuribacter sp.]|jgi:HSP20 family molecular chaperone IbpA|nr:Hsp20/alpha crystallin family protein [Candidatus Obscuribacter sp.]MDQ5968061.1 hypothetical protein [Cyanobacteriota bacterium erpe_2018_sw_39hr_WHONDRS-SW48-000098_B_bin.30]MBK9204452.1 Hsp20/alpha crystallin family protein [Candidatus Obscuribacter sp.]MBK9620419.1 Hsp20/alpha crystallin family protein [Candidatus Obscuribacter sp.]MBK9774283.1 Hsp20/alpha crystallin family protein [Candidatus Obscuribacter sp.]